MLKAIYMSDSDIPQGMEDHYKQEGDKWILDVESEQGYQLENVNGLKSALQAERNQAKQLNPEKTEKTEKKAEQKTAVKEKKTVKKKSKKPKKVKS